MALAKFLALLTLLHVAAKVESANILLVPFQNTSHFLELDGVGKPLVARGHNLYVLFSDDTALPKNSPYKLVTYKSSKTTFNQDTKAQHKFIEESNSGHDMKKYLKDNCIAMFEDPDLFDRLRSLKLDLVIVDNFFAKCFFLVPHKLGLPFVAVGTVRTAWPARLPLLSSVSPQTMGLDQFGLKFCEETPSQSTIVRTLCRLGAFFAEEMFCYFVEEDYLKKYVEFDSVQDIRSNASVYLFNINFLLTEPLPKLPHVEYVGGLTTKPRK